MLTGFPLQGKVQPNNINSSKRDDLKMRLSIEDKSRIAGSFMDGFLTAFSPFRVFRLPEKKAGGVDRDVRMVMRRDLRTAIRKSINAEAKKKKGFALANH